MPSTITLARRLRKTMTRAEVALWCALRRKAFGGLRFRRQHGLGPYVVDFYCPAARLAIELDGGVHGDEDAALRDALRDQWIASRGVRMLRMPNALVLGDIDAAMRLIAQAAALPPHNPPRFAGRGTMRSMVEGRR